MQHHALFYVVLWTEPRALCVLGKDSTNGAISLVQGFWLFNGIIIDFFPDFL